MCIAARAGGAGMPQHAVVGTSMVAMVAPAAVSLITHHRLGNVQWQREFSVVVMG